MAMREFDAETARRERLSKSRRERDEELWREAHRRLSEVESRINLLNQTVGAALGEIDNPGGTDDELQLTYIEVIERNLKLLKQK